MFLKKITHYFFWAYKTKVKGESIPLNSSLILTDKCNLNCQHCTVSNLGYKDLSFRQAQSDIRKLFDAGSRILVITGGEPFIWSDLSHSLEDLVIWAKNLGFFKLVICTNGTFPLESSADYLWVSLDGSADKHNSIRGDTHSKIVENIKNSTHKGIQINFTISRKNFENFEVAARQILKLKNVKSILFHLFTPYIGSDLRLRLRSREKTEVIDKIYRIKKHHPLRIFNTFSGIRALAKNNWPRQTSSSITINQGNIDFCCCRRGIYDEQVCKECGCTPAVETWVLQSLKPLAIIENLRYL